MSNVPNRTGDHVITHHLGLSSLIEDAQTDHSDETVDIGELQGEHAIGGRDCGGEWDARNLCIDKVLIVDEGHDEASSECEGLENCEDNLGYWREYGCHAEITGEFIWLLVAKDGCVRYKREERAFPSPSYSASHYVCVGHAHLSRGTTIPLLLSHLSCPRLRSDLIAALWPSQRGNAPLYLTMTHPIASTTMLQAMSSFDDFLDLPPIQNSIPLSTSASSSGRPLPLEPCPNGRIPKENETANVALSGRQKALAQAKPLEDTDLDRHKQPAESHVKVPDPEQARKKAKLKHNEQIADFVHLPKPLASRPKDDKRPPFRPIAVQTLHEPPPSAALFPPITESQQCPRGTATSYPKLLPNGPTAPNRPAKRAPAVPKKRVYLRERVKWTEEETDCLVKGVAIYGMGRWKNILDHPEFHFHSCRTHVDLKDRFRVVFPPNAPDKWVRALPEHMSEAEGATKSKTRPQSDQPRKRRKKRPWSEEEDDELDRGFEIHGFAWEMIAKDERLTFADRNSNQIRDRFRLRYPESYDEHVAPPRDPAEKKRSAKAAGADRRRNRGDQRLAKGTPSDLDRWSIREDVPQQGDEIHDVEGRNTLGLPKTASTTTTTGGPDWLMELLTQDPDPDPDPDAKLAASFSQYDWDGGGDSLALAPIRWEDMAVPHPFDMG